MSPTRQSGTRATAATRAPARAPAGGRGWLKKPDLATTLVLVLPLFLLYEVGVVFTPMSNGADLITVPLLRIAHRNLWAYMGILGALTAGLLVAVGVLRRKQRIETGRFLPVLLEAAVYALSLGTVVIFTMVRILHMSGTLSTGATVGGVHMGPFTSLVMAAGAGLNEELLFRVILFGGLLYLLRQIKVRPLLAGLVAALVSSAVFSAAHYVGSLGDTFTMGSFVFRLLCGLAFVAIYRWRGFAVAAWAHALYDAYVFLAH